MGAKESDRIPISRYKCVIGVSFELEKLGGNECNVLFRQHVKFLVMNFKIKSKTEKKFKP